MNPNAPILEEKLRKIQEREEHFVLTVAKAARTRESIVHGERTCTSKEKTLAGREQLYMRGEDMHTHREGRVVRRERPRD